MSNQFITRWLIFSSLFIFAIPVRAFDFLAANGAHQLSALIGIPQARFFEPDKRSGASLTRVASSPTVAISLQSDYSNIFAGGVRDDEFILLDGETARNTVAIVSRIGHCLQIAADLKQVSHHNGSLDSAIEKWHEFFQLPGAQRNQTERDRLFFSYQSDDVSLTLDTATRHVGDTVVQFAYHSDCGIRGRQLPGALWFAGANLPSGNLEDLSGSGEMNVFFGLQSHDYTMPSQLSAGARLGLLLPGEVEGLPEVSSLIAFGNIGLQWQPLLLSRHRMQLVLQLDLHSPLFKSVLRELGNYTVQLAIGGKWNPSASHQLSAAFLEDLAIDTTPDLVFHLQYRFAF